MPWKMFFLKLEKKSGTKPTALRARIALKLICVSQFITDLQGTNYAPENDFHLFDLSAVPTDEADSTNANESSVSTKPLSANKGNSSSDINRASTSSKLLSVSDENDVYYMAGSTLNGVLKAETL